MLRYPKILLVAYHMEAHFGALNWYKNELSHLIMTTIISILVNQWRKSWGQLKTSKCNNCESNWHSKDKLYIYHLLIRLSKLTKFHWNSRWSCQFPHWFDMVCQLQSTFHFWRLHFSRMYGITIMQSTICLHLQNDNTGFKILSLNNVQLYNNLSRTAPVTLIQWWQLQLKNQLRGLT
jgi:hypothetical protein